MSALYGLHPARFERRDPKDAFKYEEVEVPWLLAAWPSYMERIDPKPVWEENCRRQMERVYPDGQIFSLTERGVPTGWLLMGQEEVYPRVSVEDILAGELANEIQKEIDREILQKMDVFGFRRQAHFQKQDTVLIPGTALIKPDPAKLPPGLVFEKKLVEARLTEMGVIGVKPREFQLRAQWSLDMGYGKTPTQTSLRHPLKKGPVMEYDSFLENLALAIGEDLPPMPHFERIETDDPPLGMYGTYPAAFVPYDVTDPEDEPWNHEPIEVAWLHAMWVYYMQQISRGMGFELSQGGVLLGVRLMHQDHHRSNVETAEDYFFQFLDTP